MNARLVRRWCCSGPFRWLLVAWMFVGSSVMGQEASVAAQALLTHWSSLTGARMENPAQAQSTSPHGQSQTGFLAWQVPTSVAAYGNYLYVADGGRRQIFRYDLTLQTMTSFAGYPSGGVAGIAVAPDLSLYVVDSVSREVLHFTVDGRLLQTFRNDMELIRPVAVVLDQFGRKVWVADSPRSQVVAFSSLGRVLSTLRSNDVRSIEAMAVGPDGLYLVDRVSRQLVVIGSDGAVRYTLGKDTLKMPGAIAVDRYNRVFVSDVFDNAIKVFSQGQLIASLGSRGAFPASFSRITGLSIDRDMLYVVDSLNARIHVFQIMPPGLNADSNE